MSSSLARLLDLQELDIAIDQLRHRRVNLAQRAELKRLATAAADAAKAIRPVVDERAELARQEKRLEDDAATVNDKATSENKRLYSGTVTSPRDLQAIHEEIESLKRRQRELEDHDDDQKRRSGKPDEHRGVGVSGSRCGRSARNAPPHRSVRV
jgi:predicted  nucleic acid-binding Zn-ribbon protein